jgi:hypothetical protein
MSTEPKRFAAIAAIAVAAIGLVPAGSVRAQDALVCTWGGTPDAPTGEVSLKPGVTLTPSTSPHRLLATGELGGGEECEGTVTFKGIARAGSSCVSTYFEGRVKGLPGVVRFEGPGVVGFVHEFLYDKEGNIVGADQPIVGMQDEDHSQAADCATPEGFTHANFSSTIELFGDRG